MRSVFITLLMTALALVLPGSARQASREAENLLAFARLYGVVRYFYPSDAAATLEWNRFAVHGVRQIRTITDRSRLEMGLKELFEPLGPGIEIGASLPPSPAGGVIDNSLVAWRYLGAGVSPPGPRSPYRAIRTNRDAPGPSPTDVVVLQQVVPIGPDQRGHTIRVRGRIRTAAAGGSGDAALWLRIERPGQPLFEKTKPEELSPAGSDWREADIVVTVPEDASSAAFGVMVSGTTAADFDDIGLALAAAQGQWTPLLVRDPGFEAASDASSAGWTQDGSSQAFEVTRVRDRPAEGLQVVRVRPRPGAVPRANAHVDFQLIPGLRARVALTLSSTDAKAAPPGSGRLDKLRATLAALQEPPEVSDLDVRLADVVVAWNGLRHFYPYWAETHVDWDAQLPSSLEAVYSAENDADDTLKRLIANARDGHGAVRGRQAPDGQLPIQFGLIGQEIAVIASTIPNEVPIGSVVSAIADISGRERLERSMQLVSGSRQWQATQALRQMGLCPVGQSVGVVVDSGRGPRTTTLHCESRRPLLEERPNALSELASGVWYVDLTRAQMSAVRPILPQLQHAPGVVFDVRGYPTDAGMGILPHLLDAPETDRWMHIPRITRPFGEVDAWESFGWNLRPASPRLTGKIVFLTDARAISYAESVMGYVADRKLGTIVGSTTAGTNGNVATFVVPSGRTVSFTGMRVTRHDGRAAYHLIGVTPDIPVSPTITGLREKRDEVLDAALAVVATSRTK